MIVVCFLIQSNLEAFELLGIKPDFLLLLVIYFSIVRGSFAGVWVGFFAGLLQDINLSGLFTSNDTDLVFFWGVRALPKALIGYISGHIVTWVNRKSLLFSALLIFCMTSLEICFSFIIVIIFYRSFSLDIILSTLIPSAFYNMCFSFIYIYFFDWIFTFTHYQLNEN